MLRAEPSPELLVLNYWRRRPFGRGTCDYAAAQGGGTLMSMPERGYECNSLPIIISLYFRHKSMVGFRIMSIQAEYIEDDGLKCNDVRGWSEEKYRLIASHLKQFCTGTKKAWPHRAYIDLYAGAGYSRVKSSGKSSKVLRYLRSQRWIHSTNTSFARMIRRIFRRYKPEHAEISRKGLLPSSRAIATRRSMQSLISYRARIV